MLFNLKQRLTLVTLLPEKVGSFAEMRMIRNLRADFQLSKEEEAAVQFKVHGSRVQWDATKEDQAKLERDLSEGELALLGEVFAQLEASKEVPTDEAFVSLYDLLEPHIPTK